MSSKFYPARASRIGYYSASTFYYVCIFPNVCIMCVYIGPCPGSAIKQASPGKVGKVISFHLSFFFLCSFFYCSSFIVYVLVHMRIHKAQASTNKKRKKNKEEKNDNEGRIFRVYKIDGRVLLIYCINNMALVVDVVSTNELYNSPFHLHEYLC